MTHYDTRTVVILDSVAKKFGMQTAAIYSCIEAYNSQELPATAKSISVMFPFLSIHQIKNSLRTLEDAEMVDASQPDLSSLNHTKYYTVRADN